MKTLRDSLVALLLVPQFAFAALPAEARKMLETFPEKKVTLPLVLSRGMEASDSFSAVRSALPAVEAARLDALSALDFQFTLSAGQGVNKNEPQSPFSPNLIETTDFQLGVSKAFRTGTATAFGFRHGRTDLGFAAIPGFPISAFGYYETRASLSLTQDLWRNFLGSSARAGIRAGAAMSEAAREEFYSSVEAWQNGLRGIFYSTWLAQAQAELARQTSARRKRMVDVIRIRLNRGTSERPDLLQVESAELQSRAQEAQTLQSLSDRWRGLVISLKLPEDWIKIDPREIPIGLDQPTAQAQQFCKEFESGANPGANIGIRRAQAQLEAAQNAADVARDQFRPRLYVKGEVAGNDVEADDRSKTFPTAFKLENPAWNFSVNLAMPLGNSAGEAQARRAAAQFLAAEANASMAQSNLRLEWVNACADLDRTEKTYRLLKEAHANQSKRAELEEQRFRIGRSTTQFVIQAQEEAAGAEAGVLGSEIERRQAAWKIIQLHPSYRDSLDQMAKGVVGKLEERL